MMWIAISLIQVPGFRTFVVETFAAKCCVYSVLDPSFNLRDANTVGLFQPSVFLTVDFLWLLNLNLLLFLQFSLFGEIVAAQKVIYEHCGNEFLIHQATKVLPAVHCPPNLAEQYCLQIQVLGFYIKFDSFSYLRVNTRLTRTLYLFLIAAFRCKRAQVILQEPCGKVETTSKWQHDFQITSKLTQSNCARLYSWRNYLQDLLMEVFHNVGICLDHLELRDCVTPVTPKGRFRCYLLLCYFLYSFYAVFTCVSIFWLQMQMGELSLLSLGRSNVNS